MQISLVGRQQSLTAAWKSNLDFADSRSTKATANLNDINDLMGRLNELLVTSASTGPGSPGREATAQQLEGIRTSINDLLNQTDYQGQPVFDNVNPVTVPVGTGLAIESVPTRQSITDDVTPGRSLDDILVSAIAAIRSGTDADRAASINESRTALDRVIVAQSVQGVRAQRIEDIGNRLTDSSLALTERRTTLEATDLTETVTTLQSKLTTLEAAQSVFARISKQSLFDLF